MVGFGGGQFNTIRLVDYIVDDVYDGEKRSTNIRFRGSWNQKIWTWRDDFLVDISDEIDNEKVL